MRQRRQAVEETGRRNGKANAGFFGEVTGDRGRVTGILLVAEGDDAEAFGLRLAREVGDRDAGQAVDVLDAVELEGVEDEVEAVGQLARPACA